MHVGGSDDLCRFVPRCAHETAATTDGGVVSPLIRVARNRRPGFDGPERLARLPPHLHEASANERVFEAVAGVEVPRKAGAARAAARLVVRHIRARARIGGLLRLPGDEAILNVDLP